MFFTNRPGMDSGIIFTGTTVWRVKCARIASVALIPVDTGQSRCTDLKFNNFAGRRNPRSVAQRQFIAPAPSDGPVANEAGGPTI